MKNVFLIALIFTGLQNTHAQCENFEMTLDVSHPTCYNYSDGNIDIISTGGTAPINGTITNENGIIVDGGKKTFSLIGGGWYYIYLIDANGCELYDSVYLINPPQMIAEMIVTDPSYPGACDGMAEVDTVLNYQGDYANIGYFWSPEGPYGIGEAIKTDLCDANYNLVINDEIGCNIIEYMAVGSVGISEGDEAENVRLFPNPTSQFVTIQTENPITQMVILDNTGRQKRMVSGEGKTEILLNLQEFPTGLYYVQITSGDLKQFIRILKQ